MRTKNNHVEVLHIGIDGHITPEFDYRFLASLQRGWGTVYIPFVKMAKEFSGMLEVNYAPRQLQGWKFGLSMAVDAGTLIDNNWGIQLGIQKSGKLF